MEQMDAAGAIRVERVSKLFRSRRGEELVEALQDVSLTVSGGEFVSLVGPSGCGKSTLLRLTAGLDDPTSGGIFVEDIPVRGPQRAVGMMFQNANLLPWRTALENALLPIDVFKLGRDQFIEKANEILHLVGLEGFAHAYPRELSGGMQQRVALSRALMADPSVMLMDEPFGSLDEFTRERLNLELLRIWEYAQKTIIFVTHNIGEAVFLSDRVIVMGNKPGRILGQIGVPLSRPRTIGTLRDPTYLELVFRARELLAKKGD